VDVLSDLLHRARAGDASVRRLVQRPPWSFTFVDVPQLTVVAALGGRAAIGVGAGPPPVPLAAGDIALLATPEPHTIAHAPGTPPRVLIRDGRKYAAGGGNAPLDHAGHMLAPRTYGDGGPGTPVLLRGAYELRGGVGARLLAMLPPLAVVPAGPGTRPALDLLASETARDEPGQDAVLHRLLDLVLVLALRAWCANPVNPARSVSPANPVHPAQSVNPANPVHPAQSAAGSGSAPPAAANATVPLAAWYRALTAPAVGPALRLLHERPAHRWTVAALAAETGLSRAAFAARFTQLVGEPPLTYLTGWRMTLAADLLRDTDATVAAIAHQVGYEDPFAFSAAFKRAHGTSPSAWRRQAAPAVVAAPGDCL
jgi:AraC-like DNA-binding protein